ncbi:MAG: hypothetical protein D6806_08135 [Deltaproteobacteria bacterium]|nr:MAG: hypothetical protein D6806_08135 [Deltaproteobacteria bacterium]
MILAVLAAGAYFLLRHQVFWLDSFEGQIKDKYSRDIPTVSEHRVTQEITYYYLVIQTQDGREVEAEVPQDLYFRARVGMKVRKNPFGSDLLLY